MAVREMPHNKEAEQSVLGAMFLSNYALQKACEELEKEFFYFDNNAQIFDALKTLNDKKIPLDITTITAEIEKKQKLSSIGGIEYLNEIINFVPTAANVDYYITIVQEKYALRKLIEVSTNIATSGYEFDGNINEMLDMAEQKILSVAKNRKTSEFRKVQDVMVSAQENLEKLAQQKGQITGVPSGFYDLDKITSGFHENELIIIAARPAMGKTAFALNIATTVAKTTGKTVALFNLEMGAEQLAMRMLSSLGQIESHRLRTGQLEHGDWRRVNEAVSQLADTKLVVDDTPGISIGEIRAKCRRLATEGNLGIIVIDYLQLIQGSAKYSGNRQQEVSEISRSLKTMAMELNVPVIALAQLSREVEKREDKRPLMSDLRESGSIEQDADIVAFLYRDDYYNKEARTNDFTSISELIIGKHRNGPTATIELLFKLNTSTFLTYKKDE